MAAEQPAPVPARDWRPVQQKAEKSVVRKRVAQPAWRKGSEEAAVPVKWRWSRQAQIGFASISFLALTALLVWASFWLMPPKSACMVLIGAGYQDNLVIPPNVFGWTGLKAMADLSRDSNTTFIWGSERIRLHQEPKELRIGDTWYSGTGKSFPEKTVIIFLALHGASDRNGAYLLPQDAGAVPTDQNRIYLTQVLDYLEKEIPPEKNKLLLLDATQMTANWDLGVLDNAFVQELKKLDGRIAQIPNLAVVSSTDVYQRSWVSKHLQRTIFTHYVIEGLKGAAGDRNNDGRVNAWELFTFVEPNVRHWVRDIRDSVQTPILLPSGREGEQRTKRMDLTVVQRSYAPPELSPTADFELPAELGEAWQRCEKLSNQVPSPADVSPHLWRRYQDYLLRYEQLVTAGDIESAADIGTKLLELGEEIMRGQRLELSALQNTLAMPAVVGLGVSGPGERLAAFNDLWEAPPQEYSKRWSALMTASGGGNRAAVQVLRVQFYEFLLERVEKNPAENLDKACNLVRIVDDPISPRPAEVQFMMMLERDRPRNPPPPPEYGVLLALALRVRVQAEKAALAARPGVFAFSATVYPWIHDLVEAGDKQRRLGEDLVLASDRANWLKAGELLQQAEATYKQAQARADAVRAALAVRDRVQAGLPYYSMWVARRPVVGASIQQKDIASALDRIDELWRETHRLAELLDTPHPEWIDTAPPADIEHPHPKSITDQAETIRRAYDRLESQFLQYCRDLANVDTQSVWRDSEDALLVPFQDYLLRQRLLTTMWRTSRRLMLESQETLRDQASPANDKRDDAKESDWHKEHGKREGLMSIAVLGKRWFDQCKVPDAHAETYQEVLRQLQTSSVEGWQALASAGEQIGYRWQELPGEINRLIGKANQANLSLMLEDLRGADTLTRQVDGAGSLQVSQNPVQFFRRIGVEQLLIAQGQRTYEDHWFAEDPQAEPYYRVAGLLYLEDAQRLDPRQGPRPAIQQLQQKLRQPGKLVCRADGYLQLTTEQRFNLNYQLAPDENTSVPDGFAVTWLDVGNGLQAITPSGAGRLVRRVGGDKPSEPVVCTLKSPYLDKVESQPPPLPRVEKTGVTLQGLYRGQKIAQPTNIDLFALANNIWYRQPLPPNGSIAVRSSLELQTRFGDSNATIAIVLDCSGSMGPPEGENYGPTTKFNEATNALHLVLSKLPRGTTVSVWAFGQRLDSDEQNRFAENSVLRIVPPVKWNGGDAAQLKNVMARVEYPALRPFNQSPIMRAILAAKNDLKNATGFKTLLVITDGMDNRFLKDTQINPDKKDIPTALRENFNNSGIMVNVIGFKVEDDEEKKAREQFEMVRDLTIPGKYFTVTDSVNLVAILDNAMRQKLRYAIDTAENLNVASDLNVSRIGENIAWYTPGLRPGGYRLRIYTDRRIEKDVQINSGDMLLVDVTDGPNGVEFVRGLYTRTDGATTTRQEQSGWRGDVIQDQQLAEQALQMLVALQKTPDKSETVLEMLKPRDAWIELEPQTEGRPIFSQRWGYLAGYAAPAWSFDVPQWPRQASKAADGTTRLGGPARPTVRIWWNPDQETTFATRLDRGNHFNTLPELTKRQIQVDGDMITIDSVQIEDHYVETRPGLREVKSCLVVRISHALGKPVWSAVAGFQPEGHEHRFYSLPNKYTGLFWPVTQATSAQLTRLSLISLSDFKKDATKRGFSMELKDTPIPQVNDNRPPQPVNLGSK